MRVGVSLTSAHAVDDVRAGARMMIERAAAARDAGLDSLFVGDHHLTPAPYYQNTPMLGRLLAEWGDEDAGALFLLPLWDPVLAAEQIGTLAAIAQGRFILQCAVGRDEGVFAGMGRNIRHRPSLFEQGLDIVRRLLGGETVSSDGRYHIEAARIAPLPPEPVEIWIGGSAEPSIDRAARLGDAWLAGPELPLERARHWIDFYRERCAAHGRTPVAIPIRRDVYVGESEAEADAVAGPVAAGGYRGFAPDALIFGSAEQVADRFRALATMGYTDVIVRSMVQDQPHALASLRRLRDVREAVSDA